MSLTRTLSKRSDQIQNGAKVAVLIADGFEQTELQQAMNELKAQGLKVEILAPGLEEMRRGIQGIEGLRPGGLVHADRAIQDAVPMDYVGVLIPGGPISADRMRESRFHLGFVQTMLAENRPIAASGHAVWILADSGVAQGKTLTSWPNIRKDLERAGAIWKDQAVMVDGVVITSRSSQDLPQLCREFFERLLPSSDQKVAVA
jgi:protease I